MNLQSKWEVSTMHKRIHTSAHMAPLNVNPYINRHLTPDEYVIVCRICTVEWGVALPAWCAFSKPKNRAYKRYEYIHFRYFRTGIPMQMAFRWRQKSNETVHFNKQKKKRKQNKNTKCRSLWCIGTGNQTNVFDEVASLYHCLIQFVCSEFFGFVDWTFSTSVRYALEMGKYP